MSKPLPTLKELNAKSCSDNMLLLLRVLNTSDFTFTFDLLQKDTLKDILRVSKSLVDSEKIFIPEEQKEFAELWDDINHSVENN